MKLFLLTLTALLITACGSKPEPEIIFDDGKTYEEVISEPYTADQFEDEDDDHSDHDHE